LDNFANKRCHFSKSCNTNFGIFVNKEAIEAGEKSVKNFDPKAFKNNLMIS